MMNLGQLLHDADACNPWTCELCEREREREAKERKKEEA